jgi:hypothetical protein
LRDRGKQKDHELKANWGYIARSCLKKTKANNQMERKKKRNLLMAKVKHINRFLNFPYRKPERDLIILFIFLYYSSLVLVSH